MAFPLALFRRSRDFTRNNGGLVLGGVGQRDVMKRVISQACAPATERLPNPAAFQDRHFRYSAAVETELRTTRGSLRITQQNGIWPQPHSKTNMQRMRSRRHHRGWSRAQRTKPLALSCQVTDFILGERVTYKIRRQCLLLVKYKILLLTQSVFLWRWDLLLFCCLSSRPKQKPILHFNYFDIMLRKLLTCCVYINKP